MVDYTNLYIKNLDLNVKSVDLFNNFRRFGRIISARVMKNAQTKQSKGFGFVSFSKADEAQKAKHEMNGEFILSKPVIVAFHEPKKAREADVSVSPTQSTFNGSASHQQMVATSVSPHLVQQYNSRLSPPPPPTPSFPSSQNGYEQKQQSNGSGYHANNTKPSSKNATRYASNPTMPQQKYNNHSNSYQQTYTTPSQQQQQQQQPPPPASNGFKAGYQPMERNNSNLSHHHQSSMVTSHPYDQRQQQQQQQTNQVWHVFVRCAFGIDVLCSTKGRAKRHMSPIQDNSSNIHTTRLSSEFRPLRAVCNSLRHCPH